MNINQGNYKKSKQSFGMAMKYKGTGKSAFEKAVRDAFDVSGNEFKVFPKRVKIIDSQADYFAKKITEFNNNNHLHHVEVEEYPSQAITVRILQGEKEIASSHFKPKESKQKLLQVIHSSIDTANELTQEAFKIPANKILNAMG